jgi:hypothetical protein
MDMVIVLLPITITGIMAVSDTGIIMEEVEAKEKLIEMFVMAQEV